jgi:cation diffusion facilitator CzcD-associated flavoprotein CzcO
MSWSTSSKTWTLNVTVDKITSNTVRSRFVLFGTGYYDYHQPLRAHIPGIENFTGSLVHPQYWPTDLDYKDKNVVIIGSGATAITLLPNVAKDAGHVTMLQRSPSYILSVPNEDFVEKVIRFLLPGVLAGKLIRFKWIIVPLLMVNFCRAFPRLARRLLMILTAKELPKGMSLDPNFTPSYNPWEQRLCMCPESDFYESMRNGRAEVKTDVIENVDETSIRLKSGEKLHPDIIVTATGLKLCIAGGIKIFVDGSQYDIGDNFMWKFAMMDNLPNAVFSFGYIDASWTLGADAAAILACRLLGKMKKDSATMVVPRMRAEEKEHIKKLPFLDLKATYVREAEDLLPNVGDLSVWKPRSYYWRDLTVAAYGSLQKGLEWTL